MMRLHADEKVVYPKTIPRALREFLELVLAKDPKIRPSAPQAKNQLAELLATRKLGATTKRTSRSADVKKSSTGDQAELEMPVVAETIMSSRRSLGLVERTQSPAESHLESSKPSQETGDGSNADLTEISDREERRVRWWWITLPVAVILLIFILGSVLSSQRTKSVPLNPAILSPTNFSVDFVGSTTKVNWDQPKESSSTVFRYLVRGTEGATEFSSVVLSKTGTTRYHVDFKGVKLGAYSFSLSMETKQGKVIGNRQVVSGAYGYAPASPSVSASLSGKEIFVSWRVLSDGGNPITHFQLTDNHGGKYQFSGRVRKYALAAPVAGFTYRFQVTATNAVGESASKLSVPVFVPLTSSSQSITPTTLQQRKSPIAARPRPPTNLNVVSNGQPDGVTFSWTDPSEVKGYILYTTSVVITSESGATVSAAQNYGLRHRSIVAAISSSGQYLFRVTAEFIQEGNNHVWSYSSVVGATITVSNTQAVTVSP